MTEQSLKEISNFIDEAKIYYLATVDGGDVTDSVVFRATFQKYGE